MAAAAPIFMLGSAIVQGIGAAKAGEADAQASEYNAQTYRQNAALTRQQGAEEERKQRIIGAKALGDIKSGYAASGVRSNEGSALDVLTESAETSERDALTIRNNYENKARGYDREAELEGRRADSARTKGMFGFASSFLTGAGGAMSMTKADKTSSGFAGSII